MTIQRHLYSIILFSLTLFSLPGYTFNYSFNNTSTIKQTDDILMLQEKTSQQYSADDIANIDNAVWQTVPAKQNQVSLPKGVTWLKINFDNQDNQLKNVYLILRNHFQLANVKFFYQFRDFSVQELTASLSHANFYHGNVQIQAASELTLYLRLTADTPIKHSLTILNAKEFEKTLSEGEFFNGIAIGGMVFLSLIFWIIYIGSNEKLVGILAAYFTLRTLLLSVFLGGNLFYFFEQHPDLRGFEIPILASLSSFFYLWFASTLFQLRTTSTRIFKITRSLRWGTLLYIPIGLTVSVDTNIHLAGIVMLSVMAYLLALGIYQIKLKKKISVLFSVVIFLHLLFSCLVVMIEYLDITLFANREVVQMTSFWLNSLLVITLISRLYHFLVKDKQKAQVEALEHAVASKKAQENLIKLQEENQEELEQRVQERTLELNIALNELESLNIELEQKNTTDELTSLHNRRFYDQKILAEYRRSKRNLTPLSLVILDIDHFKQVNDNYGHLAGDKCLSWTGQIIKQNLKRSTDLACRYGGEEFVLILPDTDQAGALALAESIRKLVKEFEFIYQKQQIPLTISCGVSTYLQQDNITPKEIFLAADKALYAAKNAGRNQVKFLEISSELINPE